MSMVQAHFVKAFTKNPAEGNPAGVVLDDLSEAQMPEIASVLGFSATAFLRRITDEQFSVRFFSPRAESQLCVHALIASAHTVLGKDSSTTASFSTPSESFDVACDSGEPIMVTLPDPVYGEVIEDRKEVAAAIATEESLIGDWPIQVVSTGKPKILIPIRTLDSLLEINPRIDAVRDLCLSVNAEGIFLFCSETNRPESTFHARHFNPIALDKEDPICGNASGALAAYLRENSLPYPEKFLVEMGSSTNLPGTVFVNAGRQIQAGGFAVEFDIQSFQI